MVSDDHGGPIAGAMVSALGTVTVAKAMTDAPGWFSIDALPIGDYTIQAHRTGFVGSARATVRVGGLPPALQRLQLRRLDSPVATTGTRRRRSGAPDHGCRLRPACRDARRSARRVRNLSGAVARDDHPHNETAWRLRHIKRSILKDAAPIVTVVEQDGEIRSPVAFGRAMDSAASLATTFFTDLPFSGEVNLLTTGAFGPGELFSGDVLPRGVAYMAIGAPTPAGEWSVRAAMSQGDLSSWIVAGAFQSRRRDRARVQVRLFVQRPGLSRRESRGARRRRRRQPQRRRALRARPVGDLPRDCVEYGARYGRYDYLGPAVSSARGSA